jgi:stage V sporulation protein R
MNDELQLAVSEISAVAESFGLDPFPMHYELCPASIIRTFASYGMPSRYTHWSFGKAYHRLRLNESLGLGKIYELVINHDPCYAFLLDSNSYLQNKLIVAHVLAHSDFFRHNYYFANTNRQMMETMRAAASRLQTYETEYGVAAVEEIIDAAHSLQMHPNLLSHLVQFSPTLSAWQQDILHIVRDEMAYFRPQIETKIANEGWATYWHRKIMRALLLTDGELVEFAQMHASVIQPSRHQPNPYQLGLALFEQIEHTQGSEAIFEARSCENDASLLRNYLTADIVAQLTGSRSDWQSFRDSLVASKTNLGAPTITISHDSSFALRLDHAFEGLELDLRQVEKTLPHVHKLWGQPIQLHTVIEKRPALFTFDGVRTHKKFG